MEELNVVKACLQKEEMLKYAARMIEFDQATVCPDGALEEKNEIIADLNHRAFMLRKDENYVRALEALYGKRAQLDERDRAMVELYARKLRMEKHLSKDEAYARYITEKQAFVEWCRARDQNNYALFQPALQRIMDLCRGRSQKREYTNEERKYIHGVYDALLDEFEAGINQEQLDTCFASCKERIQGLMQRIGKSKKTIRTDFLSRTVPKEQQLQVAEYLMDLLGFDRTRGTFSTSEHAFTEQLSRNDIRITTHIYPDNFLSNIYTVLHETGHALFDQLQPVENHDAFLTEGKTLGQHESVSRFYENIIGRSEPFIRLIYPKLKELMPEALSDVSERELYEAANLVTPSLIRTEADEVTYGLHVIIRYELEKEIFSGKLNAEELPAAWNQKYTDTLGITPPDDKEGVLQDVHWTSDFGYFPTYLLGNLYNAMYYRKMRSDLDVDHCLLSGDFETINTWMKENVFLKADLLRPADWLLDITGRTLTSEDFTSYLEKKYEKLYEL